MSQGRVIIQGVGVVIRKDKDGGHTATWTLNGVRHRFETSSGERRYVLEEVSRELHAMRAGLFCSACGEAIQENMAPTLLDSNGVDSGGDILCEGCAEDELDAVRSADADARELGTDYADEYGE